MYFWGGLNSVKGQSITDKNQLILECLSFESLQKSLPKEVQSELLQECTIVNHGLDFNGSYDLMVNRKKINFIDKSQINELKPFFQFHTISIDGKKAFVRYYFTYFINKIQKIIPITIDFEKDTSWKIIKFTI